MPAPALHLDFESKSACELTSSNAYVYAEDPSTALWCACYSVDDGPVETWLPGDPVPFELIEAAADGWKIVAHNAAFERTIWRLLCVRKYGWPDPSKIDWNCTMARGMALSLPGSLDKMSRALGLANNKDDAGHRLMMKMAKPRSTNDDGSYVWWDDEDHLRRLVAYCKQDVIVERDLDKVLFQLRQSEQRIWKLDQKINDRGFCVDLPLVETAKEVVKLAMGPLNAEMYEVTGGAVQGCTNVQQLKTWLHTRGVETDSLDKEHLAILQEMDLPADALRAVELRAEASKVSTAKLNKMVTCRSDRTGRVNGSLQYHAATTGRWGGRGVQPQNFPRPSMEMDEIEQALRLLSYGPEAFLMSYDRPLDTISNMLRSFLIAGKGRRYVSADFSNIEGRVLAWLAGQHDKLERFTDYDEGTGPDLYLVAAGGIFGLPPEAAKPHRQIGKVSELALGFQGGPSAFAQMAKTYGLKIEDHFDTVWGITRPDIKKKVQEAWESRGKASGMAIRKWCAGEAIKIAWRENNMMIVHFWWDLEECALQALREPGRVVELRNLKFLFSGGSLFIQLPSGRSLCYPYARIVQKKMPWKDKSGNAARKDAVRYKGVDTYTKKWQDIDTYGGKLSENITQAVARDVMAEAMERTEAAGYPLVLTVHDEEVAEPPADFGSVEEFADIMAENPEWAVGLPIAVDHWEGERYRK